MSLESKIESILFFKNEPVSLKELSKWLEEKPELVKAKINELQNFYAERGIVIVTDGDLVSFGTSPNMSDLIEKLQKEEFSRELGRAGLETLSVVLYKGPVSRREIDHIRGVNSSFILRNLLVRGLIERDDSAVGRGFSYKPTLELFKHLGITKREELPEYNSAFKKIEEFVAQTPIEEKENE